MKLLLVAVLGMIGVGCADVNVPAGCGQLDEKLSEYQSAINEMKQLLDTGGGPVLRDVAISADGMQKKQAVMLKQCAAAIIALGPDCREYHLIGEVQDLRSSFRLIARVGMNRADPAGVEIVGAVLSSAKSKLAGSHTQKNCARNQ
ncbi:hypothetical protein FCE95_00010 [Luteimonas gilva]|uniref:Uncharacterized protein n=1 Tax=Luteimonas gilva TaxID=2572684 RepID=A0A4U5JTF6_9GAMM|nr:hypothetical protein [Luteimonas gilva]TKR32755.1 hypothetical protein FCE95_00010 [Luteimonas gilva]